MHIMCIAQLYNALLTEENAFSFLKSLSAAVSIIYERVTMNTQVAGLNKKVAKITTAPPRDAPLCCEYLNITSSRTATYTAMNTLNKTISIL
ncbi:hypothetical protein SDC9_89000 [bioreactor metagenome]|uniref:Uncharacterized protein n=1 Tax=bioreactor metagenome TaxID=1076179 RepID=A0A644ZN49_9ZZZZ